MDRPENKSDDNRSRRNSGASGVSAVSGVSGASERSSRSGSVDLSAPAHGSDRGGVSLDLKSSGSGGSSGGGRGDRSGGGGGGGGDGIALAPLGAKGTNDYHQIPLLLEYDKKASSIRVDFTTIDWFFTTYKLKAALRAIREQNREKGWWGWAQNHYLNLQGWLVLLAIGICTAITASFIHTAAKWLGEIKLGACQRHGFWLDQTLCCLDVESLDISDCMCCTARVCVSLCCFGPLMI